MKEEKKIPSMNASLSFDIPVNEKTADFFKRMCDEQAEQEQAVRNRIHQLFDEFFDVEDKTTEKNAYSKVLKVFSIGYQLGWNDHHNLEKMERTINIKDV